MSVHKNAIYRDAYLQWYFRNTAKDRETNEFLLSLCNFEIEDFGDHPVPNGLSKGNLAKQVRKGSIDINNLDPFAHNSKHILLSGLAKNLPKAKIGLVGVYHYIGKYSQEIFEGKQCYDSDKLTGPETEFYKTIFCHGCTASYHSPVDFIQRSNDAVIQLAKTLCRTQNYLKCLWKIKSATKDRKYKKHLRRAEKSEEELEPIPSHYVEIHQRDQCYSIYGNIIIIPKHKRFCYIFNQNDLNRIEEIINGFATARFAPYQEYTYQQADIDKYSKAIISYQELVLKAMEKTTNVTAQLLCRSLDVCFHIYLAQLSQDIDDRAVVDQKAKWAKEQLNTVINRESVCNTIKDLPIQIGLQVLLQYKALPQPDFDYFGAAKRQEDLYIKRRAHAVLNHACEGRMFEEILLYHKWLMMITFKDAHGRLPGTIKITAEPKQWHVLYPNLTPDKVPFRDVDDIDFAGDFAWVDRSVDVLDMLKDKAICPTSVRRLKNSADLRALPVQEKNYLLNWASKEIPPDISKMSRETCFYDLKAEDKAEAKKPNGRWFFEAGSDARMLQSQYEESVAFYAEKCPGSVNGVTVANKLQRMQQVARCESTASELSQLLISFDIDKFSPTLLPIVHLELDKQWAEAFGVPDLVHSSKIFTEGNVHYIKGPIHHTFPKHGADFEGFAGRKLTFYHCAVMGYCIRTLREAGIIDHPASFACLIDDGALRLSVKKTLVKQKKDLILTHLERVYSNACLFISWDKTYVSQFLLVFLNEIKYLGRSINPGLKSLLRITAKSDKFNATLLDELQQLESTCRGAASSGAPLMLVYCLYVYWVVDLIKKWGPEGKKRKMNVASAWKCFLPISLGGLALTTPLLIGGAVSHTSVSECLGNLRNIAVRFPILNPEIEAYINEPLETNTIEIQANEPLRIRTMRPYLRTTRMQHLVLKHLHKRVKNPVLLSLIERVKGSDAGLVESLLAAGAFLPVELRESMKAMEPQTAIDTMVAKFANSNTSRGICPKTPLIRIAWAQRVEAKTVLMVFFTEISFKPRYRPAQYILKVTE